MQFSFKAELIDALLTFCSNQRREVSREAERIIQFEDNFSVDHIAAGLANNFIQQLYPFVQRAQETFFFLTDHFAHERLSTLDFREEFTHLIGKHGNQLTDERLFQTQKTVSVTNRTTQNAANHITRTTTRWQLSICNRKRYSPHVIGNYPHRHIALLSAALIRHARDGLNFFNQRTENIRVIVRLHTLECHAQALEAHTGVDVLGSQRNKRPISLALKLHEHIIPHFNHLRMVIVHQRLAIHLAALLVGTDIDVDFRTRTTRTRISHLPKVVFLIAAQDAVFRNAHLPNIIRFLVKL